MFHDIFIYLFLPEIWPKAGLNFFRAIRWRRSQVIIRKKKRILKVFLRNALINIWSSPSHVIYFGPVISGEVSYKTSAQVEEQIG